MELTSIYSTMCDESYVSDALLNCPEMFDIFPFPIYWKNSKGEYLGRNLYAAKQMVFQKYELTLNKNAINHKTDFDLFDQKSADLFRMNDLLVLSEHEKVFHFVEEMILPSGDLYENISVKRAILNEKEEPVGIIGCSINIDRFSEPTKSLESVVKQRMIAKLYNKVMRTMSEDTSLDLIKEIHMSLTYLIPISKEDRELKKILLLTPREFDCLCLLLKGFSAKKIGLFLNISYRTIEIHINHIKEKLNLTHKNEIVSWFWGVLTDFSQ